jgi:hypothetical protein
MVAKSAAALRSNCVESIGQSDQIRRTYAPVGLTFKGRKGMSEGVVHGAELPAPNRSQPAYGDARFSYEQPPKAEEHLDGRAEIALAVAIVVPVIAAYGALAYALHRAAGALV